MMSMRRAPSAFLIPISRTRSATETSMTFMTPMPATMSEMLAMPPRSAVMVSLTDDVAFRSSSWVLTVYELTLSFLSLAKYEFMSSFAASTWPSWAFA